jgi:hypothetical protein
MFIFVFLVRVVFLSVIFCQIDGRRITFTPLYVLTRPTTKTPIKQFCDLRFYPISAAYIHFHPTYFFPLECFYGVVLLFWYFVLITRNKKIWSVTDCHLSCQKQSHPIVFFVLNKKNIFFELLTWLMTNFPAYKAIKFLKEKLSSFNYLLKSISQFFKVFKLQLVLHVIYWLYLLNELLPPVFPA